MKARGLYKVKNRGSACGRGYADMSQHIAFGDAAADACDALLSALQEHHRPGVGEIAVAPSRSAPRRLTGSAASPGSPAAWCAELGGSQ